MTRMHFTTERLVIRDFCMDDLPGFDLLQSSQAVLKYTGSTPQETAENKQDLIRCINNYSTPGSHGWIWAVLRKGSDELIGTTAVFGMPPQLGYRMREE